MDILWKVFDDKSFCNMCLKKLLILRLLLPTLYLFSHRFHCQLLDLKSNSTDYSDIVLVTFMTFAYMVLDSYLGWNLVYLEWGLLWFLVSPTQQMLGQYLTLVHDCFFPYPFQFIVRYLSCHSVIYSPSYRQHS